MITFTGTEFTATGLQNGESVGSATLTSAGAAGTANVAGSPYAIAVSNATGGTFTPSNYTITYDPGLLTVNPAALTITANNISKSYGQVFTFTGTEFGTTGLQNGESVGSATLTSAGTAGTANVAGSPYAITVSNATGGTFTPSNYTITYDPGLLTVNAAALTITANDISKSYGQVISFTGTEFTATGLQNGQTVGSATLTSAGAVGTANVAGSPYAVTVSNAIGGTFTPGNYSITYDPGLLTVNPAALTHHRKQHQQELWPGDHLQRHGVHGHGAPERADGRLGDPDKRRRGRHGERRRFTLRDHGEQRHSAAPSPPAITRSPTIRGSSP